MLCGGMVYGSSNGWDCATAQMREHTRIEMFIESSVHSQMVSTVCRTIGEQLRDSRAPAVDIAVWYEAITSPANLWSALLHGQLRFCEPVDKLECNRQLVSLLHMQPDTNHNIASIEEAVSNCNFATKRHSGCGPLGGERGSACIDYATYVWSDCCCDCSCCLISAR